ncbi:LysR family transcriptional regulator [Saccharopolyspora sp. NPDC050389]|uniref:LysR family transcriptional regulator n=1 Tax=Saccharopolyspora sp. NPDC050389 TaxID=3155516 RepID=UPI0033D6844C
MADLEVRELRYFRAVAEERNFSRAAERLGMAQPPLSRAIRQLERRLGVQLLERGNRQVTPTTAGLVLLGEAVRVLDAVTAAAHRTRRAALDTPTVVVTAKPGVATDLLRRIAETYGKRPDAARVEIIISGYGEEPAMLRTGRADVALLGSPNTDHHGLDREPLTSEPRVAALPAGHELARHGSLSCHDLVGLPFPQPPGTSRTALDYWAGRDTATPTDRPVLTATPPAHAPRPAGEPAPPPTAALPDSPGPLVRDSSQLLEAVALGQAVALIPLSLAERNRRDDVVHRPVSDASPYTISIAWPSGARSASVAAFVRTAIEVTADARTSTDDLDATA